MNKHHIDKDLKSIKLKLDEPQSNITTWKPPLNPLLSNDVNAILKEFDAFSRLPKILQDNLHLILDTCITVEDVLELYEDGYIRFYPEYKSGYEFVKDFYPEYKSKYDYARATIAESGDVSEFMLDYIDYDKYISDFEMSNTIIELPNDKGVIIING